MLNGSTMVAGPGHLNKSARELARLVASGDTPLTRIDWYEPGGGSGFGETFESLGVYVCHGTAALSDGRRVAVSSCGSGRSPSQRLVSAVLEAGERIAGLEARPTLRASHDQLGAAAIDPRWMVLDLPDDQADGTMQYSATAEVDWVLARSVDGGGEMLIHRQDRGTRGGFYAVTSNGMAAGRNAADATRRGLLELVERDAVMSCWLGQLPAPPIDPGALVGTEPIIGWLCGHGFDVELFDVSTEIELPVTLAVATAGVGSGNVPLGGTIVGAGAAASQVLASEGALLEVVQEIELLFLHIGAGGGWDDVEPNIAYYAASDRRDHFDFLRSHGPEYDRATRPARGLVSPDDLGVVVRALTRAGFDCWVVDRTPPWLHSTGFVVVETFAPGLQPLTLGPGTNGNRLDSPRLRTMLAAVHGTDRVPDLRPQPLG